MKKSIRFLSFALILTLLLGLLPVQAAEGDCLSGEEWKVLLLTNRERLKEGLEPVTAVEFLQNACDIRAEEIEELFDHTRPDGTDCFTVFDEVDAPTMTAAGENIAAGYQSPAAVVEGWMNSPGHRANILRESFVHMGVGYYAGGESYYHHWVQLFFTGWGCEYTEMTLLLPEDRSISTGTSIDEMGITACLTCACCGESYLPVMEEFCTGYDPQAEGEQTVTVSCFGLTAEFSLEAEGALRPEVSANFSDVSGSDWYCEAVGYAVENGLMNGMGEGKFEPDTAMSRAMLVTVLWRYAGSPVEGTNDFTDVSKDAWYAQAVAWAAKNGVVTGVGDGKFDPEGKITREQMAAILYRYSKALGLDVSQTAELSAFPDGSKTSDYAKEALSWAVAEGLITGTKNGSSTYLDPQGSATRAQVATILMRYIENTAK